MTRAATLPLPVHRLPFTVYALPAHRLPFTVYALPAQRFPFTVYRLPFTPVTTAFITGATEGIGRATAFALGRAGYRVGVCARTEPKVRHLLEALEQEGIKAAGGPADVGDPSQA